MIENFKFLLMKAKIYKIWLKWMKLSFELIHYHEILLIFMEFRKIL